MKNTQYEARPSFRSLSDYWCVEKWVDVRQKPDKSGITFFVSTKKWFNNEKLARKYAVEKNKCLK
jgi:hypothetical protein